jgi:uncharacterized protein YaaN involved in tellurite resistance
MTNQTSKNYRPEDEENLLSSPIPSMSSVPDTNTQSLYAAGTIREDMLSAEEKEKVNEIVKSIHIDQPDEVYKYGNEAQMHISSFTSEVLSKVKTHDLGEVGQSLKELTVALNNTTRPQKKGIMSLFGKAKTQIETIKADYDKAERNVDKIERDLVSHQRVLANDISLFQQMYELNMRYYKEITLYIISGKKALDLARHTKLEQLKIQAEQTQAQEDIQAFRDYDDLCNRFERKIFDLETTRMIAMQMVPQIRLLQNNDREMYDKLQSSLSNTIPLWRNQLVLSLGIEHSQKALEAQSLLTEKTNELMKQNSQALKKAVVESAKEADRPLVEISTLNTCSQNLIESLNEVMKIHEQSDINRQKAADEMLKIEENLKQALLQQEK